MNNKTANAVRVECAVLAFFLAWSVVATRPLLFHPAEATLAGGDPLGAAWSVHWLSGHVLEPSRFFHGNLFHPAPYVAVLSDLALGTVVLVLPFRPVLHDPVPLFNLSLLLALAFSGWAFHLLVWELTGNRVAGLVTGILATFGSHQMVHLHHLNLISTGWLPLFLLGLHRVLRRPSAGSVALAGTSFTLIAQSSGYYAVIAVILALVFAAAHARALDRRVLAALGGAALLAMALTIPYLRAYSAARAEEGLHRPPGMSISMSFRPERDLGSQSLLYGSILGRRGECLFPGLLALTLAGFAVFRGVPGARLYALATAALLVFSLGPQVTLGSLTVPLPYAWLRTVPALDAMRHPYTFAAAGVFTLGVLAGLGWAAFPLAARPGAGVVVVLIALAETLGPPRKLQDVPAGLPPAYRAVQSLAPGPVLEVPVFEEQTCVWAARHGLPVLNGLGSAFVPSRTLRLERLIRNQWMDAAPDDLDATRAARFLLESFDVRYVVVPVGRRPELEPLARAFDRSLSFHFVAAADDGDRIYEAVRDGAEPMPSPRGESGAGDQGESQ